MYFELKFYLSISSFHTLYFDFINSISVIKRVNYISVALYLIKLATNFTIQLMLTSVACNYLASKGQNINSNP